MKCWTIPCALGACTISAFFLPAIGWAGQPIDWSSQPKCLPTWIAAGQRTVTPAEVTGKAQEHLALRDHNPHDILTNDQSRTNSSYLITGNKVDLVATCDGFDYVRFHGPKRISTGWVEETRVKVTGSAHSTLPPDAPAICHVAEDTLNSGKRLDSPLTTELNDTTIDHILPPRWQPGSNASPTKVAHILVDGRPLSTIIVDSGGTSHDTAVYVLSNDLKTLLSPSDRDDRDVENDGADDWGFGVSEDIVLVDGQPMVRSSSPGRGSTHLSLIDRDGDIVPACEIKHESRKERVVAMSVDSRFCSAILAGEQVPVPMHNPLPGESLVLSKVPAQFSDHYGHMRSTATQLNYHDTVRAAGASYTLLSTGTADLDNSGSLHRIGIVSFWEGDSSAGDGTYTVSETFPVYLNKNGLADLSSSTNNKLAGELPQNGTGGGRLVTLSGTTYLELSPNRKAPTSVVWKIESSGAQQICSFKSQRVVVRPITD